jgi:hypothetical protein
MTYLAQPGHRSRCLPPSSAIRSAISSVATAATRRGARHMSEHGGQRRGWRGRRTG